jgi:hypothetical protein
LTRDAQFGDHVVVGYEPDQLIHVEREEQEARLRLDAARAQQLENEGESPTADHELIKRLEADWKHALERLHLARKHSKD